MKAGRTASLSMSSALIFLAACAAPMADTQSTIARSTRTGTIHDVKIGETITPKELQVRLGDEIRWVNIRNGAVKLVFVDPLKGKLSCQSNFTGGGGLFSPAGVEAEANVNPNQSASLCFSTPGTYIYTARMAATVPGGEVDESGVIRVE